MAQAIKTVLTYNLDGATKDFNIPFEYLARKFVVVTLIGVDRKVLRLNQDYRFATRTTISTTLAWGPATGYQQIEIRRYTSATERLVDFTDGSILRAYDLNVAQVQTLHVAEEARDLTADTIGVNNDGNLDARGRRIVNLADAVLDSDAISFGQVKRMNENSWQARNESLQFRNESQGFRNEAEQFKNQTSTLRAQTATDRAATGDARDQARQFKDQAAASQVAAANSQSGAATSAQKALSEAERAKKWASNPKDQVVEGGEFSALHYAKNSSYYSSVSKDWAQKPKGQVVADGEYSSKHYATIAKEEAAKLGNWNLLAGTIDKVAAGRVEWKYDLTTPVLRASSALSLGSGWSPASSYAQPFFNFHRGGTQIGSMEVHENGLKWVGQKLQVFNVDAELRGKTLRSLGNAQFDSTATINGTLRVASPGYIIKDNVQHNGGNQYQTNGMHYAIGGLIVDTYLHEVRGSYHEYGYHLYGADADMWYNHASNGNITYSNNRDGGFNIVWPSGTASIAPDGNVKGNKWGGWISEYINQRAHDGRRGPQQFTGRQNNPQHFEVPNGYITGFQNDTGDGNIRYSGWYFRIPMLWSQARGWFEFQNQ